MQNEFENNVDAFASTIKSLYFNETKRLTQKIQQQDAEIKELQLTCSNHTTTIQQLNESISTLQKSNEDLKAQLQEKEVLLEKSNSAVDLKFEVSLEGESLESCEKKITYNKTSSPVSKTNNSEVPNKVV